MESHEVEFHEVEYHGSDKIRSATHCRICDSSPCSWDGLFPDNKHMPYPREHEAHKCLRNGGNPSDEYVIRSHERGLYMMRFDRLQAQGQSCYVCRRGVTHGTNVLSTTLQVIGATPDFDLKDSGYYLARHLTCTWPIWPCGCPYEYIDWGHR